jgi:Xaa-Pro aminopeptidase
MRPLLVAALLVVLFPAAPHGERMGYSPQEFSARRATLAKQLGRGTLVMFGSTMPTPAARFRQDNDFFYLTGNESLNAVLVMDAPSGASHLFMPRLSESDVRYEGSNWLDEQGAAKKYGFASMQPVSALHDFLARRRSVPGTTTLWTRLSERDTVSHGRYDTALATARRLSVPLGQQPSEDAVRAATIRALYPYFELQDVTPHLDALRLIKTAREIEILRHNGRISAEAMERAIRATQPGRYEYELEAEATHWLLRNGLQGPAYSAIVGSGPMGNQWHYESNGRRMSAGELVVMDYGGSLDHLTMDLTRTWPVSRRFTDEQLRAYQTVLDAQKAIIAAIRPGVTRETVRTLAENIFRKNGFDPRYAYAGHYVGLSVHDVGDWGLPFRAGMVLAIEPIIDLPERQLHVRIEDTVLVTQTGTEILSGAVPKEAHEMTQLVGTGR